MARCVLCNARLPFFKGGHLTKVGEVCNSCKNHYDEINRVANAADRVTYEQLKRGFLERTQKAANLKTVDNLFKVLDNTIEKAIAEEERRRAEEAAWLAREAELSRIPVITTDNLEGFIACGAGKLLSASTSVRLGAIYTDYGGDRSLMLENAKNNAVKELKSQALDSNCNAVVGLQLSYVKMEERGYEYMLVSAVATGVRIIGKGQ